MIIFTPWSTCFNSSRKSFITLTQSIFLALTTGLKFQYNGVNNDPCSTLILFAKDYFYTLVNLFQGNRASPICFILGRDKHCTSGPDRIKKF